MISAFAELKESREHLVSLFSTGAISEHFQENYTDIMDQYFRRSLQLSKTGQQLFKEKIPCVLMAVGGYGRLELCIHSDIDILILFGSKMPVRAKNLSDEIFLPLWDLGLDLGYGIRTIKDCISLSREDFEALTSLMDARFICGDSPLFLSMIDTLQKKVISRKAVAFGRWLQDQDKIRMAKFGDASYLLEPNLKEGIGGLRDYHHMLWLGKAFFNLKNPRDLEIFGKLSHYEFQELHKSLQFIWLVRNYLHYLSNRENDCLGFEYQEKIADRLGFKDQVNLKAVEQFLGKLHACMADIKLIHNFFIKNHLPKKKGFKKVSKSIVISEGLCVSQGETYFKSATDIVSQHHLLMDIFELSCTSGCPLSLDARRLVRDFLFLVDDTFRRSKKAVQSFLNIMNSDMTVEILNQMFKTGFLEVFIPEFGVIKDRVQFDAYHMFPVGRHSLETVKYLKEIPDQKDVLLLDIFSEIDEPLSLFLAALFHDVGKIGENHSQRGAKITQKILERFGFDNKAMEDILFLVGNHLFLAEIATRRDLNDEKVVVFCARTVGDVKRLKMLYLLTWADSQATGPRAWNNWTANLIQELFFKTLHILQKGELATFDASKKVGQTRAEVSRKLAGRIKHDELNSYFDVMSPRYILNTSPDDIVYHLSMARQLKEKLKNNPAISFLMEARKNRLEDCWEVISFAGDRPGIFCDLAGVLALNNINILSAQIYTWRDGTAVDIFKVTAPLDFIHPDETWKKVKRDLKDTFVGKLSLDYRIGRKASHISFPNTKRPVHAPEIVIDNESSDFFTIIEVFTDDNVGMLYLITRMLYNLKLDIRIAKIGTKGDQIADIFYVRDLEGQKIEDEKQVSEIKKAMLYQFERRVSPGFHPYADSRLLYL